RAITRYGKQRGLVPIEFDQFESVTGHGLRGRLNGVECLLGKRDWLAGDNRPALLCQNGPKQAGVSEIWLSHDGLVGRIVLRDDVRPQARQVLQEMRQAGLQAVVLTGDGAASAEHLRKELEIGDVRAELKPEEKLAEIHSMTAQG